MIKLKVSTVLLLAATSGQLVSGSPMLPTGFGAARSFKEALVPGSSSNAEVLAPVPNPEEKLHGIDWPPLGSAQATTKGKRRRLHWGPVKDEETTSTATQKAKDHIEPLEGNPAGASPPTSPKAAPDSPPHPTPSAKGSLSELELAPREPLRLNRVRELADLKIPPRHISFDDPPAKSTLSASPQITSGLPPRPPVRPSGATSKSRPRSKLSPDAEPFVARSTSPLSIPPVPKKLSPNAEPFELPIEKRAALLAHATNRFKAALGPSAPFSLLRREGDTQKAKSPSELQAAMAAKYPKGPLIEAQDRNRALLEDARNVKDITVPQRGVADRRIAASTRTSSRKEIDLGRAQERGLSRLGRVQEGQTQRGDGLLGRSPSEGRTRRYEKGPTAPAVIYGKSWNWGGKGETAELDRPPGWRPEWLVGLNMKGDNWEARHVGLDGKPFPGLAWRSKSGGEAATLTETKAPVEETKGLSEAHVKDATISRQSEEIREGHDGHARTPPSIPRPPRIPASWKGSRQPLSGEEKSPVQKFSWTKSPEAGKKRESPGNWKRTALIHERPGYIRPNGIYTQDLRKKTLDSD